MTFLAYRVAETEQGMAASWQEQTVDQLPEGEVLIAVEYSSINYKDALSASGNKGVTREYPHTPGIDVAGTVLESASDDFAAGDAVVVFGYDLGMNTAGGYGQQVRVPANWVLRRPTALPAAQAMSWGTAGFTAALSVQKLERNGIKPENGPVVVTGATGGVGSVAVALLAKLGYDVLAVSGKPEQQDFLKQLGATGFLSRDDILATKGKAMAKPLYQAAVDTVGGDLVSGLIPQIKPEGALTTCGMIAGIKVEASVFPFILRGVSLLGVDSVEIPLVDKQQVLDKVADQWQLAQLEQMTTEISRSQLADVLAKVLSGQGVGRYRLNLNAE
ncbi:YhdH/YhfP family quinone oxidoreductase [Bacterioplanoides sp.]|uniref:YhdH/YhfP family quinone oxidoreductase n=1 Tax=Bacterioplanoides sp. TaxID=2066072 RepID=UPI003AFFD691